MSTRVLDALFAARLFAKAERRARLDLAMRSSVTCRSFAASLLFFSTLAGVAVADDRSAPGTFLLSMGELRVGSVRATMAPEQPKPSAPNLVMSTAQVTPGVLVIVDRFVAGRGLQTNLRLSTGAVVKKA